jgi:hypothetical protein
MIYIIAMEHDVIPSHPAIKSSIHPFIHPGATSDIEGSKIAAVYKKTG